MLFNSIEFFIFFPLVTLAYFVLPHKWRWLLLLAASYYFYMSWKAEYILLIIASTLIDFFVAKRMAAIPEKPDRKPWLWVSLVSNLGILMTFKYYGFFAANLDWFFEAIGIDYGLPISELLLPIGISFYTFQTMAYSIDVYNGRIKAERHLGYFALYVTYFPQLVAGPIERAENLLGQFRLHHEFTYPRAVSGLKQMLWGFFKKVVIADRVAVMVDVAYADVAAHDGLTMAFATFLFAFQIYCDFSGYSDIAIGASRVLGITLMENFRTPYFSKNVSEFWSRWHISLSTWFRDYLYIPLGGNRVVKWRWYYNLMVVFIVSGFWHGANWTFMMWGFLHGAYLILAILLKKVNHRLLEASGLNRLKSLNHYLSVLITFVLVLLAWVYFRAESVGEGHTVVQYILSLNFQPAVFVEYLRSFGFGIVAVTVSLLFAFILTDRKMDAVVKGESAMGHKTSMFVFSALLVVIMIAGNFGEVDFIYFQF